MQLIFNYNLNPKIVDTICHLKRLIHDLTYYEYIAPWSKKNYSKIIANKIIEIKSVCTTMNIIGSQHFWIAPKGIQGFQGTWIDVRTRFGLFEDDNV